MARRRKKQEIKLKEDVTANVIPMVDIMFLLVLFFMLAADMSQRDLEVVELPYADSAIDEKAEAKEANTDTAAERKRPTINVYHGSSASCGSYDPKKPDLICRDQSHWFYTLKGAHYTFDFENVDDIREGRATARKMKDQLGEIRREWDNENGRQTDPASSAKPSEMPVMVRADRGAPFGYIQRVMNLCSSLFIYKVAVGASKEKDEPKK